MRVVNTYRAVRTYRPRGLYLDDSDNLDHGAAVLMLVRDEIALDWKDLRAIYRYDRDGRAFHSDDLVLRGTIWALIKAGLLESENDFKGPYRVTEHALRVVSALGISLTQAANMPRTSGVAARPVFGRPARMFRAAHVFVLMPFADDLRPVYDGPIKRACERLRLSVERADDVFSASNIIEDIWAGIANALAIIADCTRKNANVFYELGMAHTLGKQVILMAQSDDDVPSDIRHIRYIKYRPTAPRKLEHELTRTVRKVVAEARTA
jgi:hypothetical protein